METRRLTRRQVHAGSGAAIAGGALAACAPRQSNATTEEVAKSLQAQTVEFWGPDPRTLPAMQLVADGFKAKYPNLTLSIGGGPLNITPESQAKFLTVIAAGTPPDVTYQDRYIPRSYALLDAVVPLDDRTRRSKVDRKSVV
jgi:ABC-type glycerol-3-phosphate transport system substrate-binding protein